MYHCHATRFPFSARLNEFAHILVPQCAFKKSDILETIEFCLGMQLNALCLHSRLFLMPLYIPIHRSLDWYHLFFLPTTDVINLVTKYLNAYRSELLKNPGHRPWSKLRKGELEGFGALWDGTRYKYRLLPSPHFNLQSPILVYHPQTPQVFIRPYTNFPEFESHVTPFAVCVNALRVLEDWQHPREIQPLLRERDTDHFLDIQRLALLALLGRSNNASIDPGTPVELQDHAKAFMRFVEIFHKLQELQQAHKSYKSDNHTQAQGHRRNTGSPEPSQHSTAKDHDPSSPTPPSRAKAGRFLLSIVGVTEADRVRDAYLAATTRDFAIPQTTRSCR
ncbi:hypothetical protein BDP27DRAFT_1370976 [Rhodocollybia butyracea]|uniref:Uncharacterized protein n=1 Tax=Rhodocollybia butyracea TaxID=206335 RepID=A0A9P5TZX8_9AGAR|nr:hypothetical protein BDP27DRAFT_1370976 [Rhodocollybia butyracea]